jgi:glycosyltransferase involved in cell wall biosynthesis
MITSIVVDNGDELLEKCLDSLANQTERVHTIVVGGPKTDYELAKSMADEVYGPINSIGEARVHGVLKTDNDMILSCDSDTLYAPDYAERARQALGRLDFVKAGTVYSFEPHPLAEIERRLFYPVMVYGHGLAFKKNAFLNHRLHEIPFKYPRDDVERYILVRMIPVPSDKSMVVWTKMPTHYTQVFVSLLAGVAPTMAIAGGLATLIGKQAVERLIKP